MNLFPLLLLVLAIPGPVLRADVVFSGSAVIDPLDSTNALLGGDNLVLLVVDRSGSGFAANTNFGLTAGDDISTFLGDPDDLIIGSNLSFELGSLYALPGTAGFNLGNGVDTGDPFGVFFFDNLAAGSTTVTGDTHYGFATHSSWLIPGDGANVDFQSSPGSGQFQQLSGFQTVFSVSPVPEPHSAGLLSGLIGFFCVILQRKRLRGVRSRRR